MYENHESIAASHLFLAFSWCAVTVSPTPQSFQILPHQAAFPCPHPPVHLFTIPSLAPQYIYWLTATRLPSLLSSPVCRFGILSVFYLPVADLLLLPADFIAALLPALLWVNVNLYTKSLSSWNILRFWALTFGHATSWGSARLWLRPDDKASV